MITVTARAAQHIAEMAAEENLKKVLRMKVKGGGCAGFSYDLAFEELDPTDIDEVFESPLGVTIIVDPISLQYLDGTELDFVTDSMLGAGFKFMNPNSQGSCGCGSSFSA